MRKPLEVPMKYLRLTILLCCSGLLHASDSPSTTDISYFTHQSKKLRQKKKHLSSKEDERLTQHNYQYLKELPNFGNTEQMEKVIVAMVKDALKVNIDPSQIVDSHQTSFHGMSGAHVFFINDKSGDLKLVFKAFRPPGVREKGMLAELSSMDLIRDRHLHTITTVKPIAVGRCHFDGVSYGLLLQSAAKGRRCDQYVKAVNDFPQGDPRREERLQLAQQMCRALGKGLAEFNGLKKEQRAYLARMGVLRVKMEYHSLITEQVKQKLEDKLDLVALKDYVKRVLHIILKMNSGRFYCHGDAGLGNIFYDSSTGKITLIDVLRIHRKITRHGSPLSRSLYDLFHVRKSIYDKGEGKLNKEEFVLLFDALYEGFFGENSDKKHDLYHMLVKVAQTCDYENKADPKERKKFEAIFHTNLDSINSLLKKGVDKS
jgi:Phosphotransferase enzyme family